MKAAARTTKTTWVYTIHIVDAESTNGYSTVFIQERVYSGKYGKLEITQFPTAQLSETEMYNVVVEGMGSITTIRGSEMELLPLPACGVNVPASIRGPPM